MPEGKGIIHAYPSEGHSRALFALEDQEIGRRVIDEIRKYAPSMPEEPLFTRVHRWRDAVCLPAGGMMRGLLSMKASGFPGVPGFFLAVEYLHLLSSLNGTLSSGRNATGDVLRHLGGA